jgi:hypothetical protein
MQGARVLDHSFGRGRGLRLGAPPPAAVWMMTPAFVVASASKGPVCGGLSVMHLSGHYSNPPEALETILAAGAEGRGTGPGREPGALAPAQCRLGNGELRSAVIRILESAGRPLGIRGTQLAVERLLPKAVSESSVNTCLSVGVTGTGQFERVAPGLYTLTPGA